MSRSRQRSPAAASIEGEMLDAYANLCGRTLAGAHARSGGPAMLAGYMGKSEVLDDTLDSFAMAYATHTKHDHALLKAATGTKVGLAPK